MQLETLWALREETIYPDLFGPANRGIFLLTSDEFAAFGDVAIDPTWLHHGVFEFAPTATRASWLYATSGYSNPWHVDPQAYDPDQMSGAGVEFIFETDHSADWPIIFLRRMLAFDIMLAAGHFGDKPALNEADRIPLRGPIDGQSDSPVHNALLTKPLHLPHQFQLPSGTVDLLHFVGVTPAEADIARDQGHDALIAQLRAIDCYPTTRLTRDDATGAGHLD